MGRVIPGGMMDRAEWLLPGLRTLLRYEAAWLRHDLVAGLVLATMLVPVGIAYAVASGVPGIYGLYATIIPLLVYALFGPSRILVLGPDSALAAVILSVVLPLSGGDPLRAVTLAGMLAVVSGTVLILNGIDMVAVEAAGEFAMSGALSASLGGRMRPVEILLKVKSIAGTAAKSEIIAMRDVHPAAISAQALSER